MHILVYVPSKRHGENESLSLSLFFFWTKENESLWFVRYTSTSRKSDRNLGISNKTVSTTLTGLRVWTTEPSISERNDDYRYTLEPESSISADDAPLAQDQEHTLIMSSRSIIYTYIPVGFIN